MSTSGRTDPTGGHGHGDAAEPAAATGNADFRRLWAGETASHLGTFVGGAVLPLLAVTVLAATPFEMGLLAAARNLGFLVIGLQVGVWVDRLSKRRVMLVADTVRAALLASVPVAWWADVLTMPHLVLVVLAAGFCTVFFDVGYQSYLPTLVEGTRLVEGNAKLETSHSVNSIAGPGFGGLLVQAIGAANAVLATAVAYAASAGLLSRIRTVEPSAQPRPRTRMGADIAEGLSFVFRSRELRAILACATTSNFFTAGFFALHVVYLSDVARLSTGTIGVMLAATGVGGLLGALTARWWTIRLGQLRAVFTVPLLGFPFLLCLPLAKPEWALVSGTVGLAGFGCAVTSYNVAQLSYRQAVCPPALLGRLNACFRFFAWGAIPLGALGGGAVGELIDLRSTLLIAAGGAVLAPLWGARFVFRRPPSRPEPVMPNPPGSDGDTPVLRIDTLALFDRHAERETPSLRVHGVDLTSRTRELRELVGRGGRPAFLDCDLEPEVEADLLAAGATVLRLPELPFDPHRSSLYTSAELLAGAGEQPYETTLDSRVHEWEQATAGSPDVHHLVARALHDEAMTSALGHYLTGRRVVGVMGGHSLGRTTAGYADASALSMGLARAGMVVATEGGAGAMEAANLGAYLADAGADALAEALSRLRAAPDPGDSLTVFVRQAMAVRAELAVERPGDSLGITPWTDVYGHDPANAFMTAVAKYLSRSLDGYGVLGVANAGLAFLPGAAGTVQEVFEAVTPGYYSSDEKLPPIVLVGTRHWSHDLPVWDLLERLSSGRTLAEHIHLVDDVESALEILGADS